MDFDVPARTADIWESESGAFNVAELFLDDQFTVSGPPAGSPINLHLRIHYHGHGSSYGASTGGSRCTISALALEPVAGDPSPVQVFQAPPSTQVPVAFADSLDFTLARTVGAPIGIQMYFRVEHGYDERIDADFVFLDLPPGANVTSCKGYTQDQPVPAFARSWGSVKATYR
jgi:hypothetical protein